MTDKTAEKQKEKTRSAAYPVLTLEGAINFLKEMKDSLGKGPYSREAVAAAFNKSAGHTARKIAALVHFGLLSRKGNVYAINDELANRILYPTSDEDRKQAVSESLMRPKLYSQLIMKFSSQALPLLLNNILVREFKINENVASEVASDFKQSAEFAGILKNGVITETDGGTDLREKIADHDAEIPEQEAQDNTPKLPNSSLSVKLPSGIVISYPSALGYKFSIGYFADQIKSLNDAVQNALDEETDKNA